jgi:1-deoxy-D-xylulose-5-phosphate synthase
MGVLERVNQPADLLRLDLKEMDVLAGEIREVILNTMSTTQGHLSSNLGIVELTLALHRVFESPRDRIVFDVGHQCYTHKLITGRRDKFDTIRKYGGLAGFPRPAESPHDVFHTGHAGASISTALGIAAGRDVKKEDYRVVAVVGDGSIGNGMSLEALNHAGHLKTDILIVLNDNTMAISKTVGALSSYLYRIMTGTFYERLRARVKVILDRFKRFGPIVARLVKIVEGEVKSLVGPGVFFEELGIRYFGPIDGHDMKSLIENLKQIKSVKGPRIVHVITKKGRGYPLAEQDPIHYYSPSKFDVKTGVIAPRPEGPASWSELFTDSLIRLAEKDDRVVAVTAAMLEGTMLKKFAARFPDRIYDVGIAEEHAVGLAAGLAASGLRPYVAMYSTFLQRSYDQVMHDVCLQNLPVVFAIDRAGLVGEDGPTHHGVFDYAYLRHLPNMAVMAPSDENELSRMMASALTLAGPSAIRFPRGRGQGIPVETPATPLPMGKARVVQEGDGPALLAIGTMLGSAIEVAGLVEKETGVKCTVVDARFVKPMDEELLVSLANKCGKLVTFEEHARMAGFGSAVLETLSMRGLSTPVMHVALPDVFIEHGSLAKLRELYGLSNGPVAGRIKAFIKTGRPVAGQ